MRRSGLVAVALGLAGCSGVGDLQQARYETQRLEQARAKYEAAADNLGRCVAAKLVAVAYADQESEADAAAWRARERVDCQAAFAELGVVDNLDEAR